MDTFLIETADNTKKICEYFGKCMTVSITNRLYHWYLDSRNIHFSNVLHPN